MLFFGYIILPDQSPNLLSSFFLSFARLLSPSCFRFFPSDGSGVLTLSFTVRTHSVSDRLSLSDHTPTSPHICSIYRVQSRDWLSPLSPLTPSPPLLSRLTPNAFLHSRVVVTSRDRVVLLSPFTSARLWWNIAHLSEKSQAILMFKLTSHASTWFVAILICFVITVPNQLLISRLWTGGHVRISDNLHLIHSHFQFVD